MIPAPFDYLRARSVDEAISLLVEHGDEAKLLAGGHSLVPLLRLRFARPGVLVDIGRIGDLAFVRDAGDELAIGPLTRHCDLLASPLVAAHAGLLALAASHVGDAQVRHRGTLGGSLCHGDPAADLPAALLALGACAVVRGPGGERTVPVEDFALGFLEVALEPDELLVEVRVPKSDAPFAFEKFARRSHDWAIVGCAVTGGAAPRVALVNMAPTTLRARGVEEALASGAPPAEAADRADEGSAPPEDLHASPDFRRHLARVLVGRALGRALGRAQ